MSLRSELCLKRLEASSVGDIVDQHHCVSPEDVLVQHPALHGLAADVPQLEGAVLVSSHSCPLEVEVHTCGRAVVLAVNICRVSGNYLRSY